MLKIGIVILNYLAYKTTIDTIDSFDKQSVDGFQVHYMIVDNCSPNESFTELSNKYIGRDNITVIKTDNNLGFACGNNYGYHALLDIMQPDFVIISNDDILLPQDGLYHWITDCYEKYHFAVLGPDVFSVNGNFHQSPGPVFTRDIKKCKKIIANYEKKLLKCRIKKLFHKTEQYHLPIWKNDAYNQFHDNLTLHGSFQVFSADYFEYFNNPYDSSTFLYMEEDILKLRCDQNKLRMIYEPNYQVHHLQAISTNMINQTNIEKTIFRTKNMLQSLKVYFSILGNNSIN